MSVMNGPRKIPRGFPSEAQVKWENRQAALPHWQRDAKFNRTAKGRSISIGGRHAGTIPPGTPMGETLRLQSKIIAAHRSKWEARQESKRFHNKIGEVK